MDWISRSVTMAQCTRAFVKGDKNEIGQGHVSEAALYA